MGTHTPGPWECENSEHLKLKDGDYLQINAKSGWHIGGINHLKERSQAETEANGRLIAAAPELLEALKELLEAYCRECGDIEDTVAKVAHNAINKAEGK